jgi:hypothetical protein
MDISVSLEWLKLRAEQEELNAKSSVLNRFQYFFASEKKRDNSLNEAAKSLGKLQMISEIIQNFNQTHQS